MLWLKESIKKSKKLKDSYSLNGIQIYIKDPLPETLDMDHVVSYISKRVPNFLMKGVDIIYVGDFDYFKSKEVNALFQDGAIYVTNEQDDEQDMIDDIVHEIAHSVEEEFSSLIYEDGKINKEFLGKRRTLYRILKAEGFDVDPMFKIVPEYNKEIDNFLYNDVGYELLNNLVNGIYVSAYASTSLREYFARGFEEFFIGERYELYKLSPVLYFRLQSLLEQEE